MHASICRYSNLDTNLSGCRGTLCICVMIVIHLMTDFRLPLPFLGAFGASLMLLYQVYNSIIIMSSDTRKILISIIVSFLCIHSGHLDLEVWGSG